MSIDENLPLGLLFSTEDVASIQATMELPVFTDYVSQIQSESTNDERVNAAKFPKPPGPTLLQNAFLYAVANDKRAGMRAVSMVREVLQRDVWDRFVEDDTVPIGFLLASNTTLQMSLAYDWLNNLLSPSERNEILTQIAEKGCVPISRALSKFGDPEISPNWNFSPGYRENRAPTDMSRWPVILGGNNFRMVMTGGLAFGALALTGVDERAEQWKSLVLESFDRCAEIYHADGSYNEGVGYCYLATKHLMLVVEAMRKKTGVDLYDKINFQGVAEFSLSLWMPHSLDNAGTASFGDSNKSFMSDLGFWIARRSRDKLAQHIGLERSRGNTIYSLIFYDETVKPETPVRASVTVRNRLDWVVTRSGYSIDDLVVAMRSGDPSNHEHADRNSMVLKYGGEVLLSDIRGVPYERHHPGWFLRTSIAHNTVLVDGRGHQYHKGEEGTNASDAAAKIVRCGERAGYSFWASDASDAYRRVDDDIESVTRSVIVIHELAAVFVVDKLVKRTQPSTFITRWHVENADGNGSIELRGNGFTHVRPNVVLTAVGLGDPSVIINSDEHRVPAHDKSDNSDRDGLDRDGRPSGEERIYPYTDLSAGKSAMESLIVTAGIASKDGETRGEIRPAEHNTGDVGVEVETAEGRATVSVFDTGTLPELEVEFG